MSKSPTPLAFRDIAARLRREGMPVDSVTGLQVALDLKATLASPALTGTPTAPTASLGTNTTQLATMAAVQAAVANLLDSAPGALDTLNELAASMGDDASFATTVMNAIAAKLAISQNLADLNNAGTARTNLGLGTAAVLNVPAAGDAASGEVVKGSDTRLTDARTASEATVAQAEAEAGTATTRRMWTAERVAQAIAALGGGGADLSDQNPAALGVTAPGISEESSRGDHVHVMPSAAAVGADPTGSAAAAAAGAASALATHEAAATNVHGIADTSALVLTGDSRLADARTPTAHTASHKHGGSDEVATATPGANVIPKAGADNKLAVGFLPVGSAAGTVAAGDDARLADARTPTAHATSHQNGGADEISVAGLSGLLADGQTPLAHAAAHLSGGADAIKLDDLAAPDDNADLNVSTSAHGLAPKAPNDTAKFLRGDASWAVPTAAVAISAAEIDVGAAPVAEASVAVADAGVTPSSRIIGGLAYVAPTGKDLDELEMDALDIKFEPAAGSFNARIRGLEGYIEGKFKIWYTYS